jgi:diaminopimelate epimerase
MFVMRVPYTKMHGTGNKILIVDRRAENSPPPGASELRELGNEATGPGFDQLMWLAPSSDKTSVASYRVFNADGSEVEQCGNGVRCVARFLAGNGDIAEEITLQSPAGPITARIGADGLVTVSMGAPVFEPDRLPFAAECSAETYVLEVENKALTISAVSMGNPHVVLQVTDVSSAKVSEIGPLIEHHERFAERTNVGFMHIVDRQTINLRVHERGVGETAACGTGACAAVVCGQRLGLLDDAVSVQLPGGQVMVSWRGGEDPVWLKGNAEWINEGMMELKE